MGKVIFGQFVHSFNIEPKEDLGPVVINCLVDSVSDVLATNKKLKDVRENELIYLVNTTIVPIPNSNKVIICGDKVRYGKCKD